MSVLAAICRLTHPFDPGNLQHDPAIERWNTMVGIHLQNASKFR
jgi:hypothetical protein